MTQKSSFSEVEEQLIHQISNVTGSYLSLEIAHILKEENIFLEREKSVELVEDVEVGRPTKPKYSALLGGTFSFILIF